MCESFPSAAGMLRLAARAIEEDESDSRLPRPLPGEVARELREYARVIHPEARRTAAEIIDAVLRVGRSLFSMSTRTDYLLCYLANLAEEWRQPLKRCPQWEEELKEPPGA
jgi:hypothetical protein